MLAWACSQAGLLDCSGTFTLCFTFWGSNNIVGCHRCAPAVEVKFREFRSEAPRLLPKEQSPTQTPNIPNQLMFSTNRTPGQLRRIVTGFIVQGKSIIESDQLLDPQRSAPDGSSYSSIVWTTVTSSANVLDRADGATRPLQGLGIRSLHSMYQSLFAAPFVLEAFSKLCAQEHS